VVSAASEVIVDQIYAAVLGHRLRAGTKLGEESLCDVFSTTRAAARRALQQLANKNIVELKPNRGAFVATPSALEAQNIFEARRTIEVTTVHKIINNCTASDIDDLRELIDRDRDAQSKGDDHNAIQFSGEFHILLGRKSGNEVLASILEELITRTSLIIGLFGKSEHLKCSYDEHEKIVAAIACRDEPLALELTTSHLDDIERDLSFTKKKPSLDLKDIFALN
jgi:DNA-binding GntR family transcriptional regulator